ncbi:uncharacterized protein [Dermacentor albipictus]|uniref:uncharacterized protein n=1 Tax=Dermacentor albipictus TaxID=60249 RepID=UPI0038FC2707
MEAGRKRRLAAMAVVLSEIDEDFDLLPRKRRCWRKDWIGRKELGIQNLLYEELLKTDLDEYRRLLRVSREQFLQLLSRVGPRIRREDTVMRRSISAETRLQVTLRYLASGESHYSLSRQFRLGHSSVNDIIHETCTAIYEELGSNFIRTPRTEEEWKYVMEGFDNKWNFPNCIGAMDGKHVLIKKPPNSGTIYRNYKKSFSIILFAVVDANYRFLYTDVGAPGSEGDAAVWQTTPLQRDVGNRSAGLPELVKVSSSPDVLFPPVFVADDAFPMGRNLMKPFGGTNLTEDKKIFNYRLSRARRVVENAFGIPAKRFGCFHTVINASPERVTAIVNAACVLHNFLGNDVISVPDLKVEPNPAGSLLSGQAASRGRIGAVGAAVRDKLCSFFNDTGAVPWQRQFAHLDVSIYRKPRN